MAAPQHDETQPLQVRASKHSDFLRIVLEGPDALISNGKVAREGENIVVKFSDADFVLMQKKLLIPYKKNNNAIIFSVNDTGILKVFTLKEPSRLVIDAFKGVTAAKPVKKDSNAGKNKISTSVSFFSTDAEASTIQEKHNADRPVSEQNHNQESSVIAKDDRADESSFIPEKFKKTWAILKKENNLHKVMAELSANKPSDVESLAVYHFIYGEALSAMKRHLEAIEQLRLAYIYASDEKLKEISLVRRAEEYVTLGFIYEAESNYFVFIKDYPSSKYLEKAHLGMANCLSETGYYDEAVEHYEKAGQSPEVMFHLANALQKLENIDEARKVYTEALVIDKTYPQRSPETLYLMGENLRMSGKLTEAKEFLSSVNNSPYKDNASISLGLIAMEESDNEEAIKHFRSATSSKNMKVKIKALFDLSLAFLKSGRLKESAATLEEVRRNYPDSSMYDEALLVLSKLYKHEGRIKESVSLLKELVYGNYPPKDVFSEIEALLLEVSGRTGAGADGGLDFTTLWKEFGQWMLDATRGEFLLKMATNLKPEGQPFLQLSSWLVENTSGNVRLTAAFNLADYYAGLEEIQLAAKYLAVVKETSKELKARQSSDAVLRIEARINQISKNTEAALKNVMSLKEFETGDYKLLGKIISDLKQSGSGNIKQALAYYEKMINKVEGENEDYVRLADFLYNTDEERALKYYRIAYEKNPKDEWTIYRIGLIVDMPETGKMLSQLEKGDNLLSRIARTKLMEINLLNKINEVYQ